MVSLPASEWSYWSAASDAALRRVRDHYIGICDSAFAVGGDGERYIGPLTPEAAARLRSRDWFGLRLYAGSRTLYHLDDGCDIWFVLEPGAFGALGVDPRLIQPDRPGDSLWRMEDPNWSGG